MAKDRVSGPKTASNNKSEDTSLSIITGSISRIENVAVEVLAPVFESYNAFIQQNIFKPLDDIALFVESFAETADAQLEMLMAIAGGMFGESNVTRSTTAKTLLSKLGNVDGDKVIFNADNRGVEASEAAVDNKAIGLITVAIEGISDEGIKGLVEFGRLITVLGSTEDGEELDVIAEGIEALVEICNKLKDVPFDVFNEQYVTGMKNMTDCMQQYSDIVEIFSDNFADLLLFALFSPTMIEGMTNIGAVALIAKELGDVIDEADSNGYMNAFKGFGEDVAGVFSVFGGMAGDILRIALTNKFALKSVSTISQVITTLLQIDFGALNRATNSNKALSNFMENAANIYKNTADAVKYAQRVSNGSKAFTNANQAVNMIIETFVTGKLQDINKQVKSINALSDYIHHVAGIYKSLALIAILSLPISMMKTSIKKSLEVLTDMSKSVQETAKESKASDPKTKKDLKSISSIVVGLGLLLLLAALTGGFVLKNIKNILSFGLVLSLFMLSVLWPFVLFRPLQKIAFKGAADIGILILTCSFVMMIGALFMLSGIPLHVFRFGLFLGLFILTVIWPFMLFKGMGNDVFKGMNDVRKMIVFSTLLMILGALYMMTPLWKLSLAFGLVLGLFIFLVMWPFMLYALASRGVQNQMKFVLLMVLTSALLMLLGAKFIESGMWWKSLAFGAILGLFIAMVLAPFLIANKFARKLKKVLPMVITMVAVSAMMLMLGALTIASTGIEAPIAFVACVVGLIGGIISMAWILRKSNLNIKDIAMLGLVEVLALGAAAVVKILADIVNSFDGDWSKFGMLCGMIALIALIMVGITGIAASIGSLVTGPQAIVFLAGVGAIGILIGIAYGIGKALEAIANSMMLMREVSKNADDIDMEMIGSVILSVVDISKTCAVALKGVNMRAVKKVATASESIAKVISDISKSVRDASNLTVKEYDEVTGRPTGKYIKLNSSHFNAAGENIKTIITTVGQALIDVAKDNKWMLQASGLMGKITGVGKTPFEKIIVASRGMGKMISDISAGVKDYAALVIPEYDAEGKIIGYKKLTETDFENAGTNIGIIIKTLGLKIADVYKDKQMADMFDSPVLRKGFLGLGEMEGKSPFEKVVCGSAMMGRMMVDMAEGIRQWTEIKLTEEEKKKIATNIGEIFTMLFNALSETYNTNKLFFDKPHKFKKGEDTGKEKHKGLSGAEKVLSATAILGESIKNVIEGIKDATKFDDKFVKALTPGSGSTWKAIVSMLEAFPSAFDIILNGGTLGDVTIHGYADFFEKPKAIDKMATTMTNIKKVIDTSVNIFKTIDTELKNIDTIGDTFGKNWVKLMSALADPFSADADGNIDVKNWEGLTKASNSIKFKEFSGLITSVNSLATDKADKFIELIDAMTELSKQMGDVEGFVGALDAKINDTLLVLADKLDSAQKTIAKSDEMQNKRAKLLQDNARTLKEIMTNKLVIEVTTDEDGETTASNPHGDGTPDNKNVTTKPGKLTVADITKAVTNGINASKLK